MGEESAMIKNLESGTCASSNLKFLLATKHSQRWHQKAPMKHIHLADRALSALHPFTDVQEKHLYIESAWSPWRSRDTKQASSRVSSGLFPPLCPWKILLFLCLGIALSFGRHSWSSSVFYWFYCLGTVRLILGISLIWNFGFGLSSWHQVPCFLAP